MSTNLLTASPEPARRGPADQPRYLPIKRRSFFRYAGATAGATALVLAGCDKDDTTTPGLVDVGSGDVGVLNYAYALEQLEAAFYAQVLTGSYFTGLAAGSAERQLFTDLALHEKIHVDFLRTAITNAASGSLLQNLTPNFSSINFADRSSVLGAAQQFEDLGVAAYNGAGRFISNVDYLTLAGKIVSVEARHAALIRDTIAYNTFAGTFTTGTGGAVQLNGDVLDPTTRQEKSKLPAEVLTAANAYLADGSKLSANSLR